METTDNEVIHSFKFIIPTILLLVLSMSSFSTHAGEVKIIIGGGSHHSFSGHNRHSNSDRLHNYNRFSTRHNIGYRDPYYGKRYYRRNSPGYGYRGYGYSNHDRFDNRRSYRSRGSYCPY